MAGTPRQTIMKLMLALAAALAAVLAAVLASSAPALAQSALTQYSGGEQVTLAGTLEKPDATTYMYGTHSISDQYQGYYALRSASVDLDAYVGQAVEVYGTLVPGYESGQVEGGPPLVEVTQVSPIGGSKDDKVSLSFELEVQGAPPIETTFFGFIPAEGGISTQLTDPDGDGLYTGSISVPQYAPGPRPVPEGTEPVTLPVQIVLASEVKHGVPLYPNLIKDFGQVLMDEDSTFSASIVFDGPGIPVEPGDDNPGNEGSGSDAPPSNDDSTDSPTGIDVLPDTGGFMPTLLGAVALLISGMLLFTGLRYTGLLRRR